MIIVTGATGKLGRHVLDALLAKVPAAEVAVAVRDPDKAKDLAARGVEVRRANYDEPASLEAALRGAEKVLLISASEIGRRAAQHRAVVDAAKKNGVKLIAYTSVLHADTSTITLAAEHRESEAMIRASGIPYVFLRNGWYVENYTENLASALQHGAMVGSAGSGRIAAATRRDFATAAVRVLTSEGHENKTYELAGDVAFTMNELAATVAKASGASVAYNDMPTPQYQAMLQSFGLPAPVAEMLASADDAIARGELDDRSGDLHRLIGRTTTPLADVVAAAVR
jgi:NAD(P)H dehydrogenase (quinone)